MGELTIRRNRGFTPPQFQTVGKATKQSGVRQSQGVVKSTGYTISETLQRLMSRVSQAESHTRESRRTLQAGESVLTEVQSGLDHIGDLLQQSPNHPNRAALQAELEQLQKDIDRMIGSATTGGAPLFLDEDMAVSGEMEALLNALVGEISTKQEGVENLPDWLMEGITQGVPSIEQILAALDLDKTATGAEIIAAIQRYPLEGRSVTGLLASLYLGAVIAGGDFSQEVSIQAALEGLQQLLDKIAEGVPLDEAIQQLTNGEFTSLSDFQAQFMDGSAPGLQEFLVNLLLADSNLNLFSGSPLLTLLAGLEEANLELLMGLLTASQSAGAAIDTVTKADVKGVETSIPSPAVMELEQARVMGQDLSDVSFQPEQGQLTIAGTEDVTIQGKGVGGLSIVMAGSGVVTLQNVDAAKLTVDATATQLFSVGVNRLAQILLNKGSGLTLDGGGLLQIGVLKADDSNSLRLTGGAVIVEEREGGAPATLTSSVLFDGVVSFAAQAVSVYNAKGTPLEPFDLVWKTLLPGWENITSVAIQEKQAKMLLFNGDPVRFWLEKGDASHGSPIHTLLLRGKDQSGRLQSRYVYLRWSQYAGAFEVVSAYPNPFTITGGEAGQDWIYEEETHTLRILSNQVTEISGGAGTDTNQIPFSGRIALADSIGRLKLALNGVICRVSSGRAFDLGRENKVTLILQRGTDNRFESGAGYAGISLGEGTSLSIDCIDPDDNGMLTAAGSTGGAGIGRDSGGSRDQASQILIRGGTITAIGSGGGAGIGGGFGAPVGDISIHGGSVTAVATYHAAAIGAGVQGECGNILITGTARILKATGGNPGADIGACLFGGCGRVLVSGGADIGTAKLSTQMSISLQIGEDIVMLPQFRLSSKALQLDTMSLLTPEAVQSAQVVLDADRRWVAQIQGVYHALHSQLEQSFNHLHAVHQYINVKGGGLVRDTATANTLLEDMRRSILLQSPQAMLTHGKYEIEDIQQLLQ